MPTPPTADAHARWLEVRERNLRNPDGWLALVALHWIAPGETTLAATGDTDPHRLVLPGALATPAMTFTRDEQGAVTTRPATGVDATLDDAPVAAGLTVNLPDDRSGPAPVLRVGRLHVTHIHRQDRPALRIRDREAPTLRDFRGVPRFEFDPSLAVPARFEPAAEGTTLPVTLVTKHVEDHPLAGVLHFELNGETYTLAAEPSGDALFVVFGDATNRIPDADGTYGGGRFVSVPRPDASGLTTIDFNRAVNPPCAFTPFATCPTPPSANRLPIAIRAGERRPAPTSASRSTPRSQA